MRISFNPSTVEALKSPPNNKDIIFDLRGHNIFARGVEFKGTDTNTWRSVTINGTSLGTKTLELKNGSNISITANGTISATNLASSSHTHPLVINGKSFSLGTISLNLGTYVPWISNGFSLNVSTKNGNDVDTGGGLYIDANTGTLFYLWLHDTSNVWYKKTASGSWKKMDAGNADTWGGYSAQLTTENTSGTKLLIVDGNNVQYRTLSSILAGHNTWRNILINGTSIGTNILNLKNGSNIVLNNSNGQVTISANGLASSTHTHIVTINGATKTISNSTTDLGYYLPLNGQIATWGTLTSANGYTAVTHFNLGAKGAFALAGKNNQMFMLLDGTIYVNEGSQEVATKPWVEAKGYVTGSVNGNTITINGVSTTWRNTWRDIKINNSSISTNALNIIQGDNITISNSNGTVRISITGLASSSHNHDDRYVRSLGSTAIESYSSNFIGNYIGMTTKSEITSDLWHIIGAAWNTEYRWTSLLALPTLNRNGVYYRSGLNDNSTYGAWIKLLDVNNYNSYIHNATITITLNNLRIGSFTLNLSNDATINVVNTWRNIQIADSSIGNSVLNFTSGLYTSSTSNGVISISPIGLASVGNCTISSTNYDSGLHIKPYYNNGGPSLYGNIIEYVSSNNGGGQLALPWSGSLTKADGTDTAVERLQYRSKKDIIKGWTAWKTIAWTSDIPSSIKNPYALNIFGVSYDGSATKTVTKETFISTLPEATATITDGTMFITSYASDNGFSDSNAINVPYKRKASALWNYIKGKTDLLYSAKNHSHSFESITSKPTTILGYGITNAVYRKALIYGQYNLLFTFTRSAEKGYLDFYISGAYNKGNFFRKCRLSWSYSTATERPLDAYTLENLGVTCRVTATRTSSTSDYSVYLSLEATSLLGEIVIISYVGVDKIDVTPKKVDSVPTATYELTLPIIETSVSNSDKLDGVHLNGIFTAFSNNNNTVSATIGGVTKSVSLPTSLKNPNAIKFKNINGAEVSYDGSAAVDLTAGTYIAKLPYGFASWRSGVTWGNTTGTSFASWNDSTGGSIDFRRDNPSSGKMSIKVNGRVYVNEGNNPVISSEYNNGFWGLRTPDGGNDWIRTPNNGIIPYVSGGSTDGHSSLGTSSWYFASAYIQNIYGSLKGKADSASKADVATKLETVRTISGGTDIRINYTFDGSANPKVSLGFYSSYLTTGNTGNYPFRRIAKLDTITGQLYDRTITLYLTADYNGGPFGILRISLRTNSNTQDSSVEVKWLVRSGFSLDSIKIGYCKTPGATYADVFYTKASSYTGIIIRDISSGTRGSDVNTWTLVSSSEVNNTTTSDKLTSKECYTSIENAATLLHNKAYTNIIASTDNGTVQFSNRVVDSNNGNTINITYSKAEQSSTSKLASWNGYELGTISPSKLSVNYANSAGSVSWGNVTGKPTTYGWDTISNKPSLMIAEEHSGKTIEDVLKAVLGISPRLGSSNLTNETRITNAWWNYLYIPHRTGIGNDNPNYGTLLLFPMTSKNSSYIVRSSAKNTVSELARIYTDKDKPTKSDVGLGNVDNTADANKSVKYATTAGNVHDGTITVTLGGVSRGTFTVNQSTNTTINLSDTNTWRPLGTGASDAAAGNHTHTWLSITDKIITDNEFNIVNSGYNNTMWFNYLPIDDRTKSATISRYNFGDGNTGYAPIATNGYIKRGSDDTYVLLGGGGHKALSTLGDSHTHTFASITNKPTTLSGYGITDGVNTVTVSGNGNAVTSASISGHTITLTKNNTFLTSENLNNYYTKTETEAIYLKLSGGTMTGLIDMEGKSSWWYLGRDNALIRISKLSGYSSLFSMKTTDGSWEMGAYNNKLYANKLCFNYASDTDYDSKNNAVNQILFNSDASIRAAKFDSGSTSSTFVKGDGSLDSTTYISTSTITNYYWANVKISATSSNTTYPTFGNVSIKDNGLIQMNGRSALLNNGTYLHLGYGNRNTLPTYIYGNSLKFFIGDTEKVSILNNGNVGIDNTSPGYKLAVNGSIYTNSWFKSEGATGWLSETYGGGWYMSDINWIRAYNNKGIYSTGQLSIGSIASTETNLNIYSDTLIHLANNDFPGIIPRVISAFTFRFTSTSGDIVSAENIYGYSGLVTRLGVGRYFADISTGRSSVKDAGKIFAVAFLNDRIGKVEQNIHQTLKVQVVKLGIYQGRILIKLIVSDDSSENDMYDSSFDNYSNFYINCYILRI